jgi:hypothetical protein
MGLAGASGPDFSKNSHREQRFVNKSALTLATEAN